MKRFVFDLAVCALLAGLIAASDGQAMQPATRGGVELKTFGAASPEVHREPHVHRLKVHPAAATLPSMKYTFITSAIDRTHGNAATLYLLAGESGSTMFTGGNAQYHPANSQTKPSDSNIVSVEDALDNLLNLPSDQLLKSDAGNLLKFTAATLRLLDEAADRAECKWDFPAREKRLITLQPELNYLSSMRFLEMLASMRLRYEIAQGHYDDAVRSMRTGFALAINLRDDGLLIQALVAEGSAAMMLHDMEELEQSAGAPNLYWALTELPRPFINMPDILQNELVFSPALINADPVMARFLGDAWGHMYTACLLPYPQALAALKRDAKADDNNPMLATLVPSIYHDELLMVRLDRTIAMYRCIESIRAYAAAHEGLPPAALDDLVDMPAPPDPATNKPFTYSVSGQTFTLDAPSVDEQVQAGTRMEVTIVGNQ